MIKAAVIPRNIPKVWNKGYEKFSISPVIPTPFMFNITFDVNEQHVPPINAKMKITASAVPQDLL